MFLTIVIAVLAAAVIVGAVLLFSPFTARLDFSVNGFSATGGGEAFFFHPSAVSVTFDFSTKKPRFRLLGRSWGNNRKKTDEEPSDTTSAPHPEDERREPAARPSPEDTETVPPVSGQLFEPAEQRENSHATPEIVTTKKAGDEEVRGEHRATEPQPVTDVVISHSAEPDGRMPLQRTEQEPLPETAAHSESQSEENVAPSAKKKDNWLKRLERNRYLFFVRNAGWRSKVLNWLLRVLGTFFRLIRFDRFQLAIRAGTSDPALTGTLSGIYQAMSYGLPLKYPQVLTFEPVFMRNHFECDGGIRVRTSLGRVLMPAGVAVITFPWVHTIRLVWCVYRRERRYRKERKTAV